MSTTTEKKPIDALREIMLREQDVKRLVRLAEWSGGRFLYQIETPFATFPKFVIGTTDAAFDDVRIKHRCGLEESSDEAWNRFTDPDGHREETEGL